MPILFQLVLVSYKPAMRRKNALLMRHNPQQQRIIIKNFTFIPQELAQANSKFQYWKQLCQLWLKNCFLFDMDVLQLFHKLSLNSLQELFLGDNMISSFGVRVLVSIDMPQLKLLYLDENQIGDQGIRWLNKANWQLECLNISRNKITVEGMRELSKGSWTQMLYAYFEYNFVSLVELLSIAKCYDMNSGLLVKYIIFCPHFESQSVIWKQIMMEVFEKQIFSR